jgi:hypothetical protein
VTDALARIGARVLATCRTLTTAPPEVRFPGALLDVTSDPALHVADAWSAVLPVPSPRQQYPADAFEEPVDDGAPRRPAFGDRGYAQPGAGDRQAPAAPDRLEGGDATPGIRSRVASRRAVPPRPSFAPEPSWWNNRPGIPDLPAAPARSRLAARPLAEPRRATGSGDDHSSPPHSPPAPPQPAARTSTRVAAGPAGGTTAAARPSVSLVRPIHPAASSAASAAGDAADSSRRWRAHAGPPPGPAAASAGPPALGAATPLGRSAYPAHEPLAPPPAPERTAPPPTRMVSGAAGLASILGAHLTAPGQPSATGRTVPATAPARSLAAAADPASSESAVSTQPAPHGDGADALTGLLDAGGADAIYDALESRLRGEFLRTYGSYGS